MGNEAAGQAPIWGLKELVERYTALAGRFGEAVPLSAFGFGKDETQNVFCALDEDYHISRFLHFSNLDGEKYTISGEVVTHVVIKPAIQSLF